MPDTPSSAPERGATSPEVAAAFQRCLAFLPVSDRAEFSKILAPLVAASAAQTVARLADGLNSDTARAIDDWFAKEIASCSADDAGKWTPEIARIADEAKAAIVAAVAAKDARLAQQAAALQTMHDLLDAARLEAARFAEAAERGYNLAIDNGATPSAAYDYVYQPAAARSTDA